MQTRSTNLEMNPQHAHIHWATVRRTVPIGTSELWLNCCLQGKSLADGALCSESEIRPLNGLVLNDLFPKLCLKNAFLDSAD